VLNGIGSRDGDALGSARAAFPGGRHGQRAAFGGGARVDSQGLSPARFINLMNVIHFSLPGPSLGAVKRLVCGPLFPVIGEVVVKWDGFGLLGHLRQEEQKLTKIRFGHLLLDNRMVTAAQDRLADWDRGALS
jgi:hypothetical protein